MRCIKVYKPFLFSLLNLTWIKTCYYCPLSMQENTQPKKSQQNTWDQYPRTAVWLSVLNHDWWLQNEARVFLFLFFGEQERKERLTGGYNDTNNRSQKSLQSYKYRLLTKCEIKSVEYWPGYVFVNTKKHGQYLFFIFHDPVNLVLEGRYLVAQHNHTCHMSGRRFYCALILIF